MKKINIAEMRSIEGGETVNCPFCGKKFSDPGWFLRLLGYKTSAKQQVQNHIYLYQCPKR